MEQLGDKYLFDDNSQLADRIQVLEQNKEETDKKIQSIIKCIHQLNNQLQKIQAFLSFKSQQQPQQQPQPQQPRQQLK
jgi:regulator of replication initiation timing